MDHKNDNKYVKARILSARAFEISVDAPINVKAEGKEKPIDVAIREYDEKKVPLEFHSE
jgi:DNA-directed RNA polymerases I, II, and III subunit RPABC2